MGDESYGFDTARVRLEEIVTQVRKKDVSLEKSLDLLEEGVRLANQCVDQIDHADWDTAASGEVPEDGDETAAVSQAEEACEATDSAESAVEEESER